MDNIISKDSTLIEDHLLDGAMLLVDKPLGWTSFDVVNKLRYTIRHRLGRKKYKVGHTGTLDPLATGLLLICISKYTKKIEGLMGYDKSYEAVIHLGRDTPSMDAESLPHIYYPDIDISSEELLAVQKQFTGTISQIPPMFSAIKIGGQALYKSARQGKVVERPPRDITIHDLTCRLADPSHIQLETTCSKGTYIRVLAEDIAHQLGTGGYLSYLRRTKIGTYDVSDAYQVEDLVQIIQQVDIKSL